MVFSVLLVTCHGIEWTDSANMSEIVTQSSHPFSDDFEKIIVSFKTTFIFSDELLVDSISIEYD